LEAFVLYTISLVVLLGVSGFFSGSEAALFSLSRAQQRSLGESHAGREVVSLLERPRRILITILLGNLFVNIFATSTATVVLLNAFGEKGMAYAFVGMSLLIILFGEIIPKAIALHRSERFATAAVFPLRTLHELLLPLRYPMWRLSESVISFLRRHLGQARRSFTWEELQTALRISRREGAVGLFEFELLNNVLEFREKFVREIMTPSVAVVSMPVSATRGELLARFLDTGHSRLPIHDDSPDDIVGILHIKDLIAQGSVANEAELRAKLRPPFYIPELTPIVQLHRELQKATSHIAMVIDEHGSFVGIVTSEDILEELVGEIRDARDPRTQSFTRLTDGRIVVSGTMELDDFNQLLGTQLVDDQYDTIAGYVIGTTGRIPHEGETVEMDGLSFHIISAEPNRIRKMRVEKL